MIDLIHKFEGICDLIWNLEVVVPLKDLNHYDFGFN